MAVAENCGTTELEEAIGELAIGDAGATPINVSSGGMAVVGSNNVIQANNVNVIQQMQQQEPKNTVLGEFS